jgi:hypothetical protein
MPRHVALNTFRTDYAAAPFAAVFRVAQSVSGQSVALLCCHCDYSAAPQLCNREDLVQGDVPVGSSRVPGFRFNRIDGGIADHGRP